MIWLASHQILGADKPFLTASRRSMKKIVLLRHGEFTGYANDRFAGWIDADLSEQGIPFAHEFDDGFAPVRSYCLGAPEAAAAAVAAQSTPR